LYSFCILYVDQVLALLAVLRLVLLGVIFRILCSRGLLAVALSSAPLVVLVEHLGGDAVEELLGEDTEQGPGKVKRLEDGTGLVRALSNERTLEFLEELERKLVFRGQSLLTDDCLHSGGVTTNGVLCVQLVGHVAVILSCTALTDGRLHETREGGQHVDWRVDTLVVKLTIDEDLSLRNVTCQVGDGMCDIFKRSASEFQHCFQKMLTVVGHGQDRNLCDGTVTALDTTSSLVDGRQIRVHVTRVTTTTGNFLTGSRHLTEGIAVGGQIGKNDQDVLLELVGVVFGGGQGETRCDDTLDAVSRQRGLLTYIVLTYVGSLAKFRNRVTRSILPFSSKSLVKKRLVSKLTPIAPKTIEKLSAWPS
jgi:hypothetical protein